MHASARQIEVRWLNRGGGSLVHVPGQLALYPILPLARRGWGLGAYRERLEQAVRRQLAHDGLDARRAASERQIDVRYSGQSYELTVPFTADFERQFEMEHERAHGTIHAGRPTEVVTLRARLTIPVAQPRFRPARLHLRARLPKPLRLESVWFEKGPRLTRFYLRESLEAGTRLPGPAVILEYSSTTVVPPGFQCRLDPHLNLRLEQSSEN